MPRSFLVKKLRCFTHHSDYVKVRSCRGIPDVLPSPEATGLDLRIKRRDSVESSSGESLKENDGGERKYAEPVKEFVPLRIPQLSHLNHTVHQPDILAKEYHLKPATEWEAPQTDRNSDHDSSYSPRPYSPISSYSPRSSSPHSDFYKTCNSPKLYGASFTEYYKRNSSPLSEYRRQPSPQEAGRGRPASVDRREGRRQHSPQYRQQPSPEQTASPYGQQQQQQQQQQNVSPLLEYQSHNYRSHSSPHSDYRSGSDFTSPRSDFTSPRSDVPRSPDSDSGRPTSDSEAQEFQKGVTVGYTYDAFFITDGRSKRKPDPEVKLSKQRYVCSECGKDYATSSNLSRHKQTHRSLDSQLAKKCPHCEKRYVSMPALSMHVLTHELKHVCRVCDKKFSRPWLLQGHLRSHSGEKPFGCAHCGKAFADRSNLRAHMQTHSKFKSHECPRCLKSFALKSYLNKHLESACFKDSECGSSDEGIEMRSMSPEPTTDTMDVSY